MAAYCFIAVYTGFGLEIRRQQAKIGLRLALLLPLVGGPFEEPGVGYSQPRPLALQPVVGHREIPGLLFRCHLPVALIGDFVGHGVPVHLADPGRAWLKSPLRAIDVPDKNRP